MLWSVEVIFFMMRQWKLFLRIVHHQTSVCLPKHLWFYVFSEFLIAHTPVHPFRRGYEINSKKGEQVGVIKFFFNANTCMYEKDMCLSVILYLFFIRFIHSELSSSHAPYLNSSAKIEIRSLRCHIEAFALCEWIEFIKSWGKRSRNCVHKYKNSIFDLDLFNFMFLSEWFSFKSE